MGKDELREDMVEKYYLHREAFFAYDNEATLEDWSRYVQSDPSLKNVERNLIKKL